MSNVKFEFEITKKSFSLVAGAILVWSLLVFVSAYNSDFDGSVVSGIDFVGASAGEVLVKLSGGGETSVQSFFGSGSSEVGTLPSGSIILFEGACPTGFSRYDDLDGRIPRGSDTGDAGSTGGSDTHTHTYTQRNQRPEIDSGDRGYAINSVDSVSASNNWPPYLNVVWCEKD